LFASLCDILQFDRLQFWQSGVDTCAGTRISSAQIACEKSGPVSVRPRKLGPVTEGKQWRSLQLYFAKPRLAACDASDVQLVSRSWGNLTTGSLKPTGVIYPLANPERN